MIEFKDYIKEIQASALISEKADPQLIVKFLVDNEWFGKKPEYKNGTVLLTDEQVNIFSGPLRQFLSNPMRSSILEAMLSKKFSVTTKYLRKFFDEEQTEESTRFYLYDFLLYRLTKEVVFCNDADLTVLLRQATMDLTKEHGDLLTFFLAWLRLETKVAYSKDYVMDKRYTMQIQNEAYAFDEYLQLLYYLFNEEYIEDRDMYQKASRSQNYTDTWLYLSMHFICALRYTDLKRIYHPVLPYPPKEVLKKIRDGTFSDNDALHVLLSITRWMCVLPFAPNKTESTTGVGSVKLIIPASCEVHFGKLFAMAEAHRQLKGTPDTPIIRKITTYGEIKQYMGEEIGNLFLESDFRSRSATKSYLQSIYMLADDILEEDRSGPNIKGYILAAVARSHKGTYGEFAATTFDYLKDAKFSSLTPEFVAFELMERGVLSFISSTLLKMVTKEEYAKLPVQKQTEMVKLLNLNPRNVEAIVSIVDQGRRYADTAIREAIRSGEDLLSILHKIGSGQAFSKQPECLCLLSAINKLCPYGTKRQCVGCEYEISTKSTLFLLIGEYNRMHALYQAAEDPLEKTKYKNLIRQIVLPKLDELLFCIKDTYGEKAFASYEELIKENLI